MQQVVFQNEKTKETISSSRTIELPLAGSTNATTFVGNPFIIWKSTTPICKSQKKNVIK